MSDPLKEEIHRVAEDIPLAARPDFDRIIERGRRQRRFQRAVPVIVVGALLLIGGSVGMGLFSSDNSPVPHAENDPVIASNLPEGPSDGYKFSQIEVAFLVTPGGDVDRAYADVRAHYTWATSSYPGARNCFVEVYDTEGSVVGRYESRSFEGLARSADINFIVPVHSRPEIATAAVTCVGGRLDSRVDNYKITNVSVAEGDLGKVRVQLDAEWQGDGRPGTNRCAVTVLGANGEQLFRDEFTLSLHNGHIKNLDLTVGPEEGYKGRPSTANVECEPFSGDARASTLPDGPAEGYLLSNFDVSYRKTPHGGFDEDFAEVSFRYRWERPDVYPGARNCFFEVYDETNSVVGTYESRSFQALKKEGSLDLSVPIHSTPASAAGRCVGERLEKSSSGTFEVTNVHLGEFTPREATVVFDATWTGEGSPPVQECVATFTNDGEALFSGTFNVAMSPSSVRESQQMLRPESRLEKAPEDVELSCSEFQG